MPRPFVTLKLATSMDGRIALANGVSQWITGQESRARVHQMRQASDAVMVGSGTVLADDPLLTVRTVPMPAAQPVRIVADSSARTPANSRLVQSSGLGRVVIAAAQPTGAAITGLEEAGAEVWRCGDGGGRVSPTRLLDRCSADGLLNIFLEGGGRLAASFLSQGLIDRIEWFRAPIIIGGDGVSAIGPLGLTEMQAARRWRPVATERIGDDLLETYIGSETS